jgi:hypothetical protein
MITGRRSNVRQNDKGKGIVYEGSVKRQTSGDQCRQLKGSARSWLPPQNGWVKLNVDAGFYPTTEASSLGVIAQNEVGAVLLTAWKSLKRCASPEEAEVKACLFAVRLSLEWIKQPTCVESDCSNLVMALGQRVNQRSSCAGTLLEIQEASNLLPACSFRYTHREGNQVAHRLAQKAIWWDKNMVMRFDMPQEVRDLVIAEAVNKATCPQICNSVVLN